MKNGNNRNSGFTLLELMIVVVIISVLAAVAYPSYSQYRVRVQRSDAQAEMMFIAQRMQTYRAANNNSFAGKTVTDIYGFSYTPRRGKIFYDLAFSPSPTIATDWTLIATPRVGTPQYGNGVICLNDQGQKFWAKGATSCTLSTSSTWDGR